VLPNTRNGSAGEFHIGQDEHIFGGSDLKGRLICAIDSIAEATTVKTVKIRRIEQG
jgi:hypothetical protein